MATLKTNSSKITPCLWFDKNAEKAAEFYTSIFKKSKKGKVTRYPEGGPMPAGSVMTVMFNLEGQDFLAMNAGPIFKFTEAISFFVNCKNQDEIDYYWEKLSKGGSKSQCGWLKDKFGLSWQIIPDKMIEMITDKDTSKSSRVVHALWRMKKIDIKKLENAYFKEINL